MSPEAWARLRTQFEALEGLPPEMREDQLTEVARSSPTVAFELRRLLTAADSAGRRMLDVSIPERLAVLQPAMEGKGVAPRELTGCVLKDRYRIESLVGCGASSEVWLARDEQLAGRRVVVKLPHSMVSGEEFQREVEALAGVHHSGVAHPLDSGRTEEGTVFLVLEWVDGRSLREILTREGPLDRELAMQVIGGVAEALDEVHRAGVLHLDVKPENVMVQETGGRWRAVLVDFGIARSLDRTGPEEGLRGSPRYMAPERFAGVESPAADVYALGVLALEVLSGQAGMAGAAKLRPRTIREALASALDSDPQARPASAGELVSRLRGAIRAWRRQVAGVAAGLTLLVALLGYQEYERREAREVQARLQRDAVLKSKEFAEAIGTLDSLSGAGQGRQFVGLWRFVDSRSNDPERLEAASEILIAAGMQYGHPGHRHMGQSTTAETTLREAQRLADKAMALAPDRWQGRKVGGQSRDALGSVLIEMGRYREAEQVLLDGLRISGTTPQLAGIHAGLLGSLSRIAFHNRDWKQSLHLRNQLVDVRRQLWLANQGAIGYWVDYSGALAARGYLFREMGDYRAALRDYAESDRVSERGGILSQGNRLPAWQLARNSLEVGRTLCLAGDVKGACLRLEKASGELRQFATDDASDQATVRELALSLAWLGKARKRAGFAAKDWRAPLEEALRLARAAAQQDPASAKAGENLAAVRQIANELIAGGGGLAQRAGR